MCGTMTSLTPSDVQSWNSSLAWFILSGSSSRYMIGKTRCGSPFKVSFFRWRCGTRNLELLPLSSPTFDNASVRLRILGFEARSESIRDVFRIDEGGFEERERLTRPDPAREGAERI
jgi:hypothetical protein